MGEKVVVKLKLLDPTLEVPRFAYPGDVAVDLRSRVDATLAPSTIQGVPTGVAIQLPVGYEAQIRPRSGLALKHGISLVNSPGTVDTSYRGEIVCIMVNLGSEPFVIQKGDRICQMAVRKVPPVEIELVDELDETTRGAAGFGSSGTT